MPEFVEAMVIALPTMAFYYVYCRWIGAYTMPYPKQVILWSFGAGVHLMLMVASRVGTGSHHADDAAGYFNLMIFFGTLIVTWWKHIKPKLAKKLAGYKHKAKMAAMRLRLAPSPA